MGGPGSGRKKGQGLKVDWGKIIGLRKKHPEYTCRDIEREAGCTRQWVQVILKNAGLPTKARKPNLPCNFCNKLVKRSLLGWTIKNNKSVRRCRSCRRKMLRERKNVLLHIRCDKCGRRLKRQRSEVKRSKHHFCGNKCKESWIAKKYKPWKYRRVILDLKRRKA